jgi:hypothetical protein
MPETQIQRLHVPQHLGPPIAGFNDLELGISRVRGMERRLGDAGLRRLNRSLLDEILGQLLARLDPRREPGRHASGDIETTAGRRCRHGQIARAVLGDFKTKANPTD